MYGHVQIGGGHLRLEAQSRTRLQLGRGLLEAHAGRLLKHQGDSAMSLDEFKQRVASGEAPERDEPVPTEQEREIILQMKAQHYATWPDDPLPALGGKTARQAVKTKSGRKAVLDLIRDMEHDEAREAKAGQPAFDFTAAAQDPGPGRRLTRGTRHHGRRNFLSQFRSGRRINGCAARRDSAQPGRGRRGGRPPYRRPVEALFREHYGRIVGMLTRLTGDRAHSEEIASDVFHKLSQRPALLESREDLTAWIYRVATNAGFDALRTNSRRRKREEAAGLEGIHAAAAPSALDAMLAEERRGRVRAVLGALKPREAQLLLLRASGLAYRELAATLGIEPVSVGTMLARAEAEFERRFRARYGEHV